MSMAIGHFAFGVGATTSVLMATGLDKKIKNTEPIRVAGGIFAMIPDMGKLVSSLDILHKGWWADAFWFHRLIDTKLDPTDNVLISAIFLVFMLFILTVFWLRAKRGMP